MRSKIFWEGIKVKANKGWTSLFGAASVLALPATLYAQEVGADSAQATAADSRMLEEVVVTARRQSESLLDVPVAVTALSAQSLEQAHVSDLTQIAEMTPNLQIVTTNSGTGAGIYLRGIGSSPSDAGLEQSVGINVDGVSVGRGRIVQAAQFDLQQVEVLKGPQALFFGKNSPAGVVSITSADPSTTLSAMARAGYELEADERYAEAYVSGPISDDLLVRIAGKFSKMDGWIKNTTQPAPNAAFPGFNIPGPAFDVTPGTTSRVARATLKWTPSSNFTAVSKLMFNRVTGNGEDAIEAYCGGAALATGHLTTISLTTNRPVTDPQSDCLLDKRRATGAIPEPFRANWPAAQRKDGKTWNAMNIYLGSLTLNYDLDNLAFTSVTGYTKIDGESLVNSDYTSNAVIYSNAGELSRTWSQEFRVVSSFGSRLNFTAGAFFEDSKRSNTFRPYLGFAGFDASNGGSMYTFSNLWNATGKTYSAYGQVRLKLAESLELAGGVRYTKEKKSTSGRNLYRNALGVAFGLAPVGAVVAAREEFENWSPEVTLTYKPTSNTMTYVAYKTGYKSGGLSTPATLSTAYVADPSLLAFEPERSKGFEAGLKAELMDRTVRLNLTGYRYTFSDLQLSALNPGLVAYFIRNAGKARTTGVEASVEWRATRELTLHAAATYNDAKYVNFTGAQCYQDIYNTPACPGGARGFYDRSGQPLPNAPKHTFQAGFDYEREIGETWKIGLGAEAIYTSSFSTSQTGNPAGIVKSFWRYNAGVRFGPVSDRWQVAVIARNIGDEYYYLYSSDKVLSVPGNYSAYTVRPRQVAIQITAKY
jgi:iron complex outermembrane receptor protein